MDAKSLARQHCRRLAVGMMPDVNQTLYLLHHWYQFTIPELATYAGIPLRSMRRYVLGERMAPPQVNQRLSLLIRAAGREIRKYSRVKPTRQIHHKLKNILVDLAIATDLVYDEARTPLEVGNVKARKQGRLPTKRRVATR